MCDAFCVQQVVSPLLALIQDQVRHGVWVQAQQALPAVCWHDDWFAVSVSSTVPVFCLPATASLCMRWRQSLPPACTGSYPLQCIHDVTATKSSRPCWIWQSWGQERTTMCRVMLTVHLLWYCTLKRVQHRSGHHLTILPHPSKPTLRVSIRKHVSLG